MSKVTEQELELLRTKYKESILAVADRYEWEPEIIAAIMSRESRCGLALDRNGLGDHGHGHGEMQVDDRNHGAYLAKGTWRDIDSLLDYAIGQVLEGNYQYLSIRVPEDILDAAAIASYNCGPGNVMKAYRSGQGVDARTTEGDYSADVFARAEEIVAAGVF
jgi:hypothetical protein